MENITNELLEFIGMYIGDGSIYKSNNSFIFELRGNLDEKEFYEKYVTNLLLKIYQGKYKIGYRSGGKRGCFGIRITNQAFIKKILSLGFFAGRKSHTIKIPEKMLELSIEQQKYLVRGLVSTDGSAYLAKINKSEVKNYPMIEYSSVSKELVLQVQNILKKLKIKSYFWTYNSKKDSPQHYIRVCGIKECEKFFRIIGLSNYKHKNALKSIINKNI